MRLVFELCLILAKPFLVWHKFAIPSANKLLIVIFLMQVTQSSNQRQCVMTDIVRVLLYTWDKRCKFCISVRMAERNDEKMVKCFDFVSKKLTKHNQRFDYFVSRSIRVRTQFSKWTECSSRDCQANSRSLKRTQR